MVRLILLVLGATFVYTGLLVYDRDPTAGISAAIIGIVLLVKPVVEATLYLRPHFSQGQKVKPKPGGSRRKGQLRAVKSRGENQEDRPTIH